MDSEEDIVIISDDYDGKIPVEYEFPIFLMELQLGITLSSTYRNLQELNLDE